MEIKTNLSKQQKQMLVTKVKHNCIVYIDGVEEIGTIERKDIYTDSSNYIGTKNIIRITTGNDSIGKKLLAVKQIAIDDDKYYTGTKKVESCIKCFFYKIKFIQI